MTATISLDIKAESSVPTGKLIKLFHLSQQAYQPNTRLVPDRNDKGYEIIENDAGDQIYFSHEMVAGRMALTGCAAASYWNSHWRVRPTCEPDPSQ
jgi:hypothetical protein